MNARLERARNRERERRRGAVEEERLEDERSLREVSDGEDRRVPRPVRPFRPDERRDEEVRLGDGSRGRGRDDEEGAGRARHEAGEERPLRRPLEGDRSPVERRDERGAKGPASARSSRGPPERRSERLRAASSPAAGRSRRTRTAPSNGEVDPFAAASARASRRARVPSGAGFARGAPSGTSSPASRRRRRRRARARGADLPERRVEEDVGREEAELLVPDVGREPRREGVAGGVLGVELGERRAGPARVGEARRHADVVPVAVREEARSSRGRCRPPGRGGRRRRGSSRSGGGSAARARTSARGPRRRPRPGRRRRRGSRGRRGTRAVPGTRPSGRRRRRARRSASGSGGRRSAPRALPARSRRG